MSRQIATPESTFLLLGVEDAQRRDKEPTGKATHLTCSLEPFMTKGSKHWQPG